MKMSSSMHTKQGMKRGVEMAKPMAKQTSLPKAKSEKPPMNASKRIKSF